MSNEIIRAAFETRLTPWAATRGLPVAWENVSFTEPVGVYLRAFLLPGRTRSQDLQRRHKHFMGIYQVSISANINTGSKAAAGLVRELGELFKPETPLVQNGITVFVVDPPYAGPGQNDLDRYVVPVSVEYRADTVSF